MCAAIIGGISMFHALAFDLIAENERIAASSFKAAINSFKSKRKLNRVVALSSSMVFENTTIFPSKEEDVYAIQPPSSTYGFQKLAIEYFCKGAYEQYGLPYVIIRPFNAVGTGEVKAKVESEVMSGNVKLAMSHVVPDLIHKIKSGQNPLHILGSGKQIRHYTNAKDLAQGIYIASTSEKALYKDFNISTREGHTVLELAEKIWNKINPKIEFKYIMDAPFRYDVQKRVPDVRKASSILGFEANTTLDETLNEIIPWYSDAIDNGLL